MVGSFNQTLEAQLSKFVSDHQRDWYQLVPLLLMAYRTSVYETTVQTPARLMLGQDVQFPVELLIGHRELEHTKLDFATELQERLEAILEVTSK